MLLFSIFAGTPPKPVNLPFSLGKVVRYGRPLLTSPLKGRNKNLSLLALSSSP